MVMIDAELPFMEAPQSLIKLREEVGNILVANQPILDSTTAEEYTTVVADHISAVVADVAQREIGDSLTETPRRELFFLAGPVVQAGVRIEAVEIKEAVANSPSLKRRERFCHRFKHMLDKMGFNQPAEDAGFAALDVFVEELNKVKLGKIQTPSDLASVARQTTIRTLPQQIETLAS